MSLTITLNVQVAEFELIESNLYNVSAGFAPSPETPYNIPSALKEIPAIFVPVLPILSPIPVERSIEAKPRSPPLNLYTI